MHKFLQIVAWIGLKKVKTPTELRTAYQQAGEYLGPCLKFIGDSIRNNTATNPFYDKAAVGYIAGYLLDVASIGLTGPRLDVMFPVIEELLSSNGIFNGNFSDLVKAAIHDDKTRHDAGLKMGRQDYAAYRRKRAMPAGLMRLMAQSHERDMGATANAFNRQMAAQVPSLFGNAKST
jgi:hypothetical protein